MLVFKVGVVLNEGFIPNGFLRQDRGNFSERVLQLILVEINFGLAIFYKP